MAAVIARVGKITGEAFARDADGNARKLKSGDVIREGEVVQTAPGGQVELKLVDGRDLRVGPGEAARLDAEIAVTDSPDAGDSAVQNTPKGFAKISKAIVGEDGTFSFDDDAGKAAIVSQEGHSFVELVRIVETVDPLAFEFGTTRFPLTETLDRLELMSAIPSEALVLTSALNPADDSGVAGDAITRVRTPNIVGTATPGALVTVLSPTGELITVTVAQDGNWSVTPTVPLPDGAGLFKVTAVDQYGERLENVVAVTVDTVAVASITVDSVTADNVVSAAEAAAFVAVTGTVGGDAKAGDTVTLVVNGTTYTGTVGAGLAWLINVAGTDLAASPTIAARVTATDISGNSATASVVHTHGVDTAAVAVITVDNVTPDNIINAAESGQTIAVTGTAGGDAKAGDAVALVVNGNTYTGTLNAGLTYSIAVPGSDLAADATIDAQVFVSDPAGNTATGATIHTHAVDTAATGAPTVVIIEDVNNDGRLSLAEINGQADVRVILPSGVAVGDTLTVTNGSTTAVIALSLAQVAAGFVDTSFAQPADGTTLTVTATITDQAGNSSLPGTDVATRDSTPPAVSNVTVTGAEDQPAPIVITLLATDVGSGVISYQLTSLPANGTLYTDAAMTLPAATGSYPVAVNGTLTLYFRPAADWNGNASFNYTATDAGGNVSAVANAGITVAPVNDNPTTSPVTLTAIAEDSGVRTISTAELLAQAGDIDGGALSVSGVAISGGNGTLVDNGNGTWSYTPAVNDDSAVSFSYTISDGAGGSVGGSATLDITPVNDNPTTSPVTLTAIAEDSGVRTISTAELLAQAGDIDGGALSVSGVAISGGNGTLVDNGNGTWSYTPAVNDDSAVSFSYTISDGAGGSVGGSATLDITPVNDAPVNTLPGSQSTNEDTAKVFGVANSNAITIADVDGGTLTTTVSTGNGALTAVTAGGATITNNGTASVTIQGTATQINAALNGLSFAPAADYNGLATLTVLTSDGTLSDSDNITVTVIPVADIMSDAVSTNEDTALTFNAITGVGGGSADNFENAGRVVSGVTQGAHGTVTFTAAGALTYTPNANYNGVDNFTYTVTSGGVTETATVNVTVNPVNDAPIGLSDNYSAVEGSLVVRGSVLANDSDEESSQASLVAVEFAASAGGTAVAANGTNTITTAFGGTVTLRADGTFDYVAPVRNHADAVSDVDSFVYRVGDGSALSAWTTVSIAVTDTGIVANADVDSIGIAGSISGNVITGAGGAGGGADVLGVDSPTTITAVSFGGTPAVYNAGIGTWNVDTSNGLLTLRPDGSYTYTSDYRNVAVAASSDLAGWTAAGVSYYGFDGGTPLTPFVSGVAANGLNLGSLTATQAGYVRFRDNMGVDNDGIGVESTSGTSNNNRIENNEHLVLNVGIASRAASVTLTDLGAGESATWNAYAADGVRVGTGTINGASGNIVTSAINTAQAFQYLVFSGGASSTYRVNGLSAQADLTGVTPDVFTYTLTDADGSSSIATLTITTDNVPEAPVNTLPTTAQTTLEDTVFILGTATGNAITVDDADGDALTTTLTVANGTLTALNFAGATITGNGSGLVTISGTAAAINGALNGATFSPAGNFSGTAQIAVSTSDGVATDSDTLSITVVPVADTPSLSFGALVYTATSITSANATTTTNGFNMLAKNPNGSAGAISLKTGSPDGFGVSGAASGDTTELGYLAGVGSERLVVNFDNLVSSVDVSFAWLAAGERYSVQFLNAGTVVGGYTSSIGGTDGVDAITTLKPVSGAQFNQIVFSAPAGDNDYLINRIVFDRVTSSGASTVNTDDNGVVNLGLTSSLADADGSESLRVVLSGIPSGFTLSDGTNSFTATGATGTTSSADVTGWSISSIKLIVPANVQGTAHLTATATATETSNMDAASVSRTVDVVITHPQTSAVDTVITNTDLGTAFTVSMSAFLYNDVGAASITAISSASGLTASLSGSNVVINDASPAGGSFNYSASTSVFDLDTNSTVVRTSTGSVTVSQDAVGTMDGTTVDNILVDTLTGATTMDGGAGNDVLVSTAASGGDILIGGAGNDLLTGGAGADTFQWNFADRGTLANPARDVITDFNTADFNTGGGDRLDLRDILQGTATTVAALDNYLDFSKQGSDTVINVRPTGAGGAMTQQIVLQGVDLTQSGTLTTDQQIIQDLLTKGKLITD